MIYSYDSTFRSKKEFPTHMIAAKKEMNGGWKQHKVIVT